MLGDDEDGTDGILEAHVDDDDGGVASLLTLRVGDAVVDLVAGPSGLPDVDDITARRLSAESVSVQVSRSSLYDLVRMGRRAPLGAVSDDDGPAPLFWMEVEPGELALSVDWEEFGEWRLSIPCRADGPSRVPVGPLFLAEYLECHEGDEELTLLLPADRRTYLVMQNGPWSGFLLPVDRTAEAHRSELEEQLQRIGLGPLVRDHDGDYAFRFGTSDLRVRLVEDEPPRVRIFSVVLSDVEESHDLLRELNSINASPYFARAFLTGDQVVVGWELIAPTIDDEELRLTCEEVVRLAAGTGPFLASLFGGRTAYTDDEDGTAETDDGDEDEDEVRLD